MAARIGEQGCGPRLADLLSLVFRYAFAFHSHPTRTSAEAHLPTVLPSPLPVVAFQCKWEDEWLQLAHQKASPAEGPWWLRFSRATAPLPSPTQHFVLTPLPPVSAYSLCPTWRGRLGTRGLKRKLIQPFASEHNSSQHEAISQSANKFQTYFIYLRVTQVGYGQDTKSCSISTMVANRKDKTAFTYITSTINLMDFFCSVVMLEDGSDTAIVKNQSWLKKTMLFQLWNSNTLWTIVLNMNALHE